MMRGLAAFVLTCVLVAAGAQTALAQDGCKGNTSFLVGTGIYDITGPAAERGMMGYAMLTQQTSGIHMRLRARAFAIESPCNGERVVIVVADLGQIFQAVKQEVVRRLEASFGSQYSDENVLLMASHTHSGPGGFSHYALYNLTTLGFDRQNFEAIASGIYQAIVRAHDNLVPGRIRIAKGQLLGATTNRSLSAYLKNPPEERARYAYDTEKDMTLLRFERADGRGIGTLNWFAVHGTSMDNKNRLVSGDNKGYASYLFEKLRGTDYSSSSTEGTEGTEGTFVAAFAQASEGDSTPNIYGGTVGEGADDFESTAISGTKQFQKARELYEGATELLRGGVSVRHSYVDFSRLPVGPAFTDGRNSYVTDVASIGFSMLAGAEDGPGFGWEGLTCSSARRFWPEFVCDLFTTPGQGEKPIVLETGAIRPHPWTPDVLPIQLVAVGQLGVIATPFEVTTMAGRRLAGSALAALPGTTYVVSAGLSNAYAGYVTTREEYATQQYEGASTHFGPWTLAGIQQEVFRLASALTARSVVDPGPVPRDLRCCQFDLQPGVVFDDVPLGKSFGSVYREAASAYRRGDTVQMVFWSGHPKNNLRIQSTFLEVQRLSGAAWLTVATDGDPETKYRWQRKFVASSHATIEWTIPSGATPGTYRIRHYGDWKSGWDGKIRSYAGTSRSFAVN